MKTYILKEEEERKSFQSCTEMEMEKCSPRKIKIRKISFASNNALGKDSASKKKYGIIPNPK